MQAPEFAREFELDGESLKRPPRGFDPEDPHIDDLKRKDHVAMSPFTEEEVAEAGFIEAFADVCRKSSPYMEFLRPTGHRQVVRATHLPPPACRRAPGKTGALRP